MVCPTGCCRLLRKRLGIPGQKKKGKHHSSKSKVPKKFEIEEKEASSIISNKKVVAGETNPVERNKISTTKGTNDKAV